MTAPTAVRPDGRTYRPRKTPEALVISTSRVMVVRTHNVPAATKLALPLIHSHYLEQVRPLQQWLRWVPWPANELTNDGHWVPDEARGVPAVVWDRETEHDLDLLGGAASPALFRGRAPAKDHPNYVRHLDQLTYTVDGDEWRFWELAPADEHPKLSWRTKAEVADRDIVWLVDRTGRMHQALIDTTTGAVHLHEPFLNASDLERRHNEIVAVHRIHVDEVFGRIFQASCTCLWRSPRRDTRDQAQRDHSDHVTHQLLNDRSKAS